MNREGLKRLLHTRNGAKDTAPFGLAQYERGRIILRVATDVLQERLLISRDLAEFVCMLVWDLIQYASTKAQSLSADGSFRMYVQNFKTNSGRVTGEPGSGHTDTRDEYALLAAANAFQNQTACSAGD